LLINIESQNLTNLEHILAKLLETLFGIAKSRVVEDDRIYNMMFTILLPFHFSFKVILIEVSMCVLILKVPRCQFHQCLKGTFYTRGF